jgi:NADPH:quinone reductase-like Zn-dependent oxidoreductase
MKAVWYERIGPAAEVLQRGELPDPSPGAARFAYGSPPRASIRVMRRPAGVSKRPTTFPRIVPQSDGAGVNHRLGPGVATSRIGGQCNRLQAQSGGGADPRAHRGRGVARVVDVDLGANLPVTAKVLQRNGVVAAYASMGVREPVLPVYPLIARNITIEMVFVYTMPDEAKRRAIADITAWLETGKPSFAIAARFPLDRLAEVHDLVERRDKIGQVIVDIG